MKCRICNMEGDFHIFLTKEMMYGTREEFNYFQCSYCQCLQIEKTPDNLESYYPQDYYSYNPKAKSKKYLKAFLQKQRCRVALFNKGYKINSLLKNFIQLPYEKLELCKPILDQVNLTSFTDPILDIGCGSNSWWLNLLHDLGFRNLTGIDPYIKKSSTFHGIITKKEELSSHEGQYKLITLHHSFEHMPDQGSVLKSIRNLLTPDGICVIRIPTVSSFVWKKYGVNWIELDPPRHLYLHSLKSIELIAKRNNLKLFKIEFDSTELEFIGSEQYLKGIPHRDKQSYFENPSDSSFTDDEISFYIKEAERVNNERVGGRAVFFLKPV